MKRIIAIANMSIAVMLAALLVVARAVEVLDELGNRTTALAEWRRAYQLAPAGSADQNDAGKQVTGHGGRF
jgi:hypothetical protein